MTIALSGGHGFIGNWLAESFKADGQPVVYIERDLDPIQLEEALKKIAPDYIFHLSAYGNHYDQKDTDQIIATNILKTYLILKATKDIPYKAFINFGSSSEYGKKNRPMNEIDLPETDTFYGASKLAGTYLCRAFARQYNKPIVTIRPFSVYGSGEAEFRFIPKVIKHLQSGEEMELAEEPTHDWIYIEDFINAVMLVAKKVELLSGLAVNIGTGICSTNLEVVKELENISGHKLNYKKVKGREYDTTKWVARNDLLKSLGWRQKYFLVDGLKATYKAGLGLVS